MFQLSDEYTPLFEELRRRNVDQTRYYEVGDDILPVCHFCDFLHQQEEVC